MKENKLKNYLKLGIFLFGISIFLWNCKDEEDFQLKSEQVDEVQQTASTSYRVTSLENIPELQTVIQNIKKIELSKNVSLSRDFSFLNDIENLNTDEIIEYTNETGYTTFSFKFNTTETSINFENLHLLETEDGGYIGYILSYQPSQDWYNEHLNTDGSLNFDVTTYQGKITKYSLEREVIWSTNLETASKSESNTMSRGQFYTVCTISPPPPCDEGNHGPGNWGGCNYSDGQWSETCQTVWGGGGSAYTGSETDTNSGGTGSGGTTCNDTTGTAITPDGGTGSGVTTNCTPNNNNGVSSNTTNSNVQILNYLSGKALCVYNELNSTGTNFSDAIKKFDGEFPVAHLKFEGVPLSGAIRGQTIAPNSNPNDENSPDYVITIQINSASNIYGYHQRPNLMVAKTIAHEVLHAELYRKLLSLAHQGNLDFTGWTRDEQVAYTISLRNNFPGIYDYYRRHKNWQHQQMATHYRENLARILQEYNTGFYPPSTQQPQQLYMDLAWEGLIYENGSNAIYSWAILPQAEKNRIRGVIEDYVNNNLNENCTE